MDPSDRFDPSMSDAPRDGQGGNGWHRHPPGEVWPASGVGSPPVATVRREPAPKRALASIGFLLDASRRRRAGRFTLWLVVIALALGGVGLLCYPLITDVWAHRIQSKLDKQFASPQAQKLFAHPVEGSPLTRLIIPKLHVNIIVVEGISGNALRAGAGHYPDTALPGASSGNIAIAGHRTGFGEPFRHLERLAKGDQVQLVTPLGTYVYQVVGPFSGHGNPWITSPFDWSVISTTPTASLTLTTCDPPHTSLNRLIVRLVLVGKKA
ncbi:MAG: class E sortase [Actinomycetota bacterium]